MHQDRRVDSGRALVPAVRRAAALRERVYSEHLHVHQNGLLGLSLGWRQLYVRVQHFVSTLHLTEDHMLASNSHPHLLADRSPAYMDAAHCKWWLCHQVRRQNLSPNVVGATTLSDPLPAPPKQATKSEPLKNKWHHMAPEKRRLRWGRQCYSSPHCPTWQGPDTSRSL